MPKRDKVKFLAATWFSTKLDRLRAYLTYYLVRAGTRIHYEMFILLSVQTFRAQAEREGLVGIEMVEDAEGNRTMRPLYKEEATKTVH